jgi:transcriptional regulator NrdR family protein
MSIKRSEKKDVCPYCQSTDIIWYTSYCDKVYDHIRRRDGHCRNCHKYFEEVSQVVFLYMEYEK